MLEREESKVSLILLLVLSILALGSTISALVISIIRDYTGFGMSTSSYSYICSNYLTLKVQYNLALIYNAIFIGGCISLLSQLIITIVLIFLVVRYCKSNYLYFQDLTQMKIKILYIGFSLSLLGICISVGYYGTFVIEEGIYCFNYIFFDWLLLGGLFAIALVFLLICWFILLCFWNYKKHKFDQITLLSQPYVQKQQQIDQPVNMVGLFQSIKEFMKQQTIVEPQRQIKQPLLDNPVQQGGEEDLYMNEGKQKLEIIPFQEYRKNQLQKKQKEYQEQQLIYHLMQQQQEKIIRQEHQRIEAQMQSERLKKQENLGDVALSPDDPNFNKIFQDSEHEEQTPPLLINNQTKEQFYPANFVPQNEKERVEFQNYKKKLLEKYKKNTLPNNNSILSKVYQQDKKSLYKHPQNIEGGRSKKLMQKYLNEHKRPSRDQSLYVRAIFDLTQKQIKNNEIQNIAEKKEQNSQRLAKFNEVNEFVVNSKPAQKQSSSLSSPSKKQTRKKHQEFQPQVLYFQKSKTKQNKRKKLFEEEEVQSRQANQTFSSILAALVKGVEETTFKNRLKQLKQQRNYSNRTNAVKRNQKLIQSISRASDHQLLQSSDNLQSIRSKFS